MAGNHGKKQCIRDQAISTRVIICDVENVKFNHEKLFHSVPLQYKLPQYDNIYISGVYNNEEVRGAMVMKKKKKKNTSFRNSINILMSYLDRQIYNIKINSTGRFQISGAKDEQGGY